MRLSSLLLALLAALPAAAGDFRVTALSPDGRPAPARLTVYDATGAVLARHHAPGGVFVFTVDPDRLPADNGTVRLEFRADGAALTVEGLNGRSKGVQQLTVRLKRVDR